MDNLYDKFSLLTQKNTKQFIYASCNCSFTNS